MESGDRLGEYELVEKIASGGMAEVHLAELDRIVMRALARNPKHRYQTAGELAADLEAFARSRSRHSSATKLGEFLVELFPDTRRVAHEEPSDRYEFGALLRMQGSQQLDWCPDTAEVSAFLDSALGCR